jgi:hypothetical protein
MRKKVQMLLGGACYVLGLAAAIYIGGVLMLLHPVGELYNAYCMGTLTVFSVAGLVWCIGYIGYNHFKGTEDPDWDEINARTDK